MKIPAVLVASALLFILPARADAQQVSLQIENGLVTLSAQNVQVRQILAEWARVGGAKIVNAEKVFGGPVTLQLNGVPERQALDTVLRGVSGYMLAARPAGTDGVSAFDRILILPTSSAPRGNLAPTNAGFTGGRRMPVPAPEPVDTEIIEDGDNDVPDPEDEGGEEEVVQPPITNPRFQRPNVFPNPMGAGQGQPYVPQPQPFRGDDQGQVPGATQPTPGNPFGLPAGASSTPGVVTPVPQQDPQQPPPQRPPRPPR